MSGQPFWHNICFLVDDTDEIKSDVTVEYTTIINN